MTDKPGSPESATLVPSSLRDQARRTIRERIISGEIEPGQIHVIGKIAKEFGVSATPVREALVDLAKEGLILMKRNRGFEVRTLTNKDLDEIVELRRMVEVAAVRKIAAARSIKDDADLRRLAGEVEEAAASGDWPLFLERDRAFELGILMYSGNQRLVEFVGSLRDQSRPLGTGQLETPELVSAVQEHSEVLDAILAGDPERAGDLMNKLLDHVRRNLSLAWRTKYGTPEHDGSGND